MGLFSEAEQVGLDAVCLLHGVEETVVFLGLIVFSLWLEGLEWRGLRRMRRVFFGLGEKRYMLVKCY